MQNYAKIMQNNPEMISRMYVVQGLEVFSYQNSRRNSEAKHFSKCLLLQLTYYYTTYPSFRDNNLLFILVFNSSCKIRSFHAWSNGTSKYFICFLTNILVRSDRFTKQSFATENKFILRTVLQYFLRKLAKKSNVELRTCFNNL